jgi:nucleoside-diphosphate-sugar epimerase
VIAHALPAARSPERVVIFGASGFVGRHLVDALSARTIPVLALTSSDMDLSSPSTTPLIHAELRPGDAVVMLSALTPRFGRDVATLQKNLTIAETLCAALRERPVEHVVYVSSDAVYPLANPVIDEDSPAAPDDLYGLMHRVREVMFSSAVRPQSLAIVRPTMIVGPGDPHNSYGPNRLLRDAVSGGRMTLGGDGEDVRDHVFVGDVAQLIAAVLLRRSFGILNLASGRSWTFSEVAQLVQRLLEKPVDITHVPRAAKATRRSFIVHAIAHAFPEFEPTPLREALALTLSQEYSTR